MTELPLSDPPFVVHGQWDDAEWRAAAAKGALRTLVEQDLYSRGPRQHPFGALAYRDIVEAADGTREERVYPTEAHAKAAAKEAKATKRVAPADAG